MHMNICHNICNHGIVVGFCYCDRPFHDSQFHFLTTDFLDSFASFARRLMHKSRNERQANILGDMGWPWQTKPGRKAVEQPCVGGGGCHKCE